jgi:hypothetical protein
MTHGDDIYLGMYMPPTSTQGTSDAGNDLDSLTNMDHLDFTLSPHDQLVYSAYPQHHFLSQGPYQFSQPTTPVSVPTPLNQPFEFDQNIGMSSSYSPIMGYESDFSNHPYANRNVPIIRLDTTFPPMGVSPAHLTGSSGTPSTFNTPIHNLRHISPFTSSPTSPLPQLNDLQTSPTSTNNVQPNVWDLARAHPASRGIPVPQKMYKPHTQSDRRRYVEEVELEPPIMFFLQGPAECGIPLRDALTGKYIRLVGRDDAMFRERGPSVSIRLKWPGYGNWSRQIPTKDFRSPPCPITRSKLAKNIARTVERFIKEKYRAVMDPDEDPRWRVGPGHITIDDLVLVGLQHVSKGSWQCHLRLNRSL